MNQQEALRETVKLAVDHGMALDRDGHLGLYHLKEMLHAVDRGDFSDAKLGRWLGWAQCAVAANIGLTLDDMKRINRRWSDG